ncbi:galactose-binding domain-containing protein [Virgibacillus salexigens]|uniref:F5/8 type C domain protein n=1 Tax=Virgibacillus massiliensis TaxID=1462526 RepID=A0A024QHW7_9BACI|nr:hypothetical protein [Virgibacillus massiliensis]CDQ41800.1 F5/8 type C domain protein [Virgibacillus massiliensis]
MDVISLSKAVNALKDIDYLNEQIIGNKAECRFKTVDHRLDWIEGQSDKLLVGNSYNIDFKHGVFNNLEPLDNKLQLKEIGKIFAPSNNNLLLKNLDTTFSITFSSSLEYFHFQNRMFDGNYSTSTNSSISTRFPGWFQLNFNQPHLISKMKFIYSGYGKPKEWIIEGSNDESVYETIYHETDETKKEIEFIIEEPKEYQYYRITWSSIREGNRITVNEIEFYELEETKTYVPQGSWTSTVIDLGVGWNKTSLVDITNQLSETTNIEVKVATSQDGISFTDFASIDIDNPVQARFLKLKAILSSEVIFPTEETVQDVAVETPVIDSIKINYDELTIEGRMKELEETNVVNLSKLNFKANSLMLSEKYRLHDLVIDTFEDTSEVEEATGTYDETNKLYSGQGEVILTPELIKNSKSYLWVISDGTKDVILTYSIDLGNNWEEIKEDTIINIALEANTELQIKISLPNTSSKVSAISFGWA